MAVTEALSPSENVLRAIEEGRPVVALETSVISHGLPGPWDARAAEAIDRGVREEGAEPAWVWTEGGRLRLGATEEDLARLTADAAKVARRDLPAALASGSLGGTTVSATIWAAHRAGIEVAATGGIGGVHPGSGDVSADLAEMARTPVTLVASGPKSILDPAATLERLEELGVAVLGYRSDRLPFFFVRDSGLPLEHRAERPEDVAEVVRARRALEMDGALLVCNPIAEEAALDPFTVSEAAERCRARANAEGVGGKALTPFLLNCMADVTDGATLEANLSLLEANARLAATIAGLVG
jgi:pseudouridine-5'-phosphate glycosidase